MVPGRNGKIAFASDRDGNFEIHSMNADGSGQTRLTNNTDPVGDLQPDWQSLPITARNIRNRVTKTPGQRQTHVQRQSQNRSRRHHQSQSQGQHQKIQIKKPGSQR
ncbi:TolB family protein [Nonomuraea sp. NPDC049480]|uniref:TolB family protein n=1 Tax=Nonomuraea sp. NPDC049480 TaxID=3364353 RepID=UPI00379A6FB7